MMRARASRAVLAGARKFVVLLLVAATVVWFILCFTGEARHRQHAAFVFACAFTFGAFAMLVMPFVVPAEGETSRKPAERPPEGVVQLVRGCVVSPGASAADT